MFTDSRQRDNLLEEKYSEQIIREDAERLAEARDKEINAKVITYLQGDDEQATPIMDVIVDDFTGPMMPEENSIIWVDIEGFLRPFKVIRYDYIQNTSKYDSMYVYIVVQPSTKSDIVKQYYHLNG
jgi:hypothetical protein